MRRGVIRRIFLGASVFALAAYVSVGNPGFGAAALILGSSLFVILVLRKRRTKVVGET